MTTERSAGRLVSVNVGLPQEVAWHGRTVRTAVWKRPVEGPRLVRRLNVVGDGQGDLAGHGGEHRAVFVYQLDSYRYWQQQLARDDFSHGLTVASDANGFLGLLDAFKNSKAFGLEDGDGDFFHVVHRTIL